jgi:hypothetical protein
LRKQYILITEATVIRQLEAVTHISRNCRRDLELELTRLSSMKRSALNCVCTLTKIEGMPELKVRLKI